MSDTYKTAKQSCLHYYSTPAAERSIAISLSVCLFVDLSVCLSVSEHIFGTAGPIFRIFCGRGSVLLWRRCDTLCTFGFMDDVMFGRNVPYSASGVDIPGRSLMSVNALFLYGKDHVN